MGQDQTNVAKVREFLESVKLAVSQTFVQFLYLPVLFRLSFSFQSSEIYCLKIALHKVCIFF